MDARDLFLSDIAYAAYPPLPLTTDNHNQHFHQHGLFLAPPPPPFSSSSSSPSSTLAPTPEMNPFNGGALPIMLAGPSSGPAQIPVLVQNDTDDGNSSDAVSKPRKMHQCSLCHKSYDRPSTLRVHQRVHTLAKDFECRHCNSRFSVASNLKRHARKCGAATSSTTSLGLYPISETTAASTIATSPTSSEDTQCAPPKPKRPRRKKTEPQWIPNSLRSFALSGFGGGPLKLPMPLPPMCLDPYSEDTDLDPTPYKNKASGGWKGSLPGPAAKQIFRIDARSFM